MQLNEILIEQVQIKLAKHKIGFYYKKTITIGVIVFVILIGSMFYFYAPLKWWGPETTNYETSKRISYGFVLENPSNKAIQDVVLWSYAPLNNTASQKCNEIEASREFRLIKGELGQQVLKFSFDVIPPYSRKQVTIRADLHMAENPQPIPAKELQPWLEPQTLVQSRSEPVEKRAEQLRKATNKKTAENILDWVGEKIRYTGFESREHGAVYALQQEKGDCTEFADLYTALCRANEIPTRVIAGFFESGNAVLHRSSYHNWAESFYSDKWHLVDPQKGLVDSEASSYVAMSILGSDNNTPIPRGKLYSVRGKGVEVRMK